MTYFLVASRPVLISLLLLLSLIGLNCLDTNESTQAITPAHNINNVSSTINTSSINNTVKTRINVPALFIKNVIDDMMLKTSDKHKDDDKKKEKKKKHKKTKEHKKHDGNASNTLNPTTTVYTTIYIVATETPTQIYTGTNQPAKQKGQKNDSDEISDPNSSSPDNGSSDQDSSPKQDSGNDDQTNANVKKHSPTFNRMVIALSVIGSVGGVILLIAAFVFTRKRVIKKKRFFSDPKDLEMGTLLPPPPPPHKYVPPPPPSITHSSYRINISQLNDGASTLIDFGDPFEDPTEEKNRNSINLPPELPVHLNPETYTDFRHNQTLSVDSQTTAAEPSAPTEKELNILDTENPFEQQEIPFYYSLNQAIYPNELRQSNSNISPMDQTVLPVSRQSRNRTRNRNSRSTTVESHGSSSDLPPPAYTPSVAPSAPPLYALPTLPRLQTIELRRSSSTSSRRHSVSSSSLSESRSLSLRRGSGSLTHISSPIS